jgi:hypothetical protein
MMLPEISPRAFAAAASIDHNARTSFESTLIQKMLVSGHAVTMLLSGFGRFSQMGQHMFKISPQIAGAIKAVAGVVDVHTHCSRPA